MAETTSLLANLNIPESEKNAIQLVVSQTFKSLANLSNLLPTCTLLIFQILLPIVSNMGECDVISTCLTLTLLIICAAFCFLQSFTDSLIDENGNVLHGFATLNGLWIMDGSANLSAEDAEKFKLKFMDFVHAMMSVMVFTAIALFNQNVINCLFPDPSLAAEQVLAVLPVGIGVIGSFLFSVFPTNRHGVGNPITTTATT